MSGPPEPDELILLPAFRAARGPRGGFVMTRKYIEGAMRYARRWPGRTTTLVAEAPGTGTDMDLEEIMPAEAGHGLEVQPADPGAFRARIANAAAVVGHLSPASEPVAELCRELGVPFVCVSEYSPRTERQILDAETRNPVLRLRRRLWLWQAERARRRILRHAAGLQCSGTPTYELYRPLQPDALLFFDNRVAEADILDDAALAAKAEALRAGRPLRLVFGGRLVPMKGVLELPEIARALAGLGVAFELSIYGSGPLEEALRRRIARLGLDGRVRLGGALDFRTGWVPLLKREADLFLCCHVQGDPASTYPEVMSCGVPIAGYANEAFAGIAERSGGGWLSPMRDRRALAALLAQLDGARGEIAETARRARDFARRHAFEPTFERRTAHLIAASRLPERLKAAALAGPAGGP